MTPLYQVLLSLTTTGISCLSYVSLRIASSPKTSSFQQYLHYWRFAYCPFCGDGPCRSQPRFRPHLSAYVGCPLPDPRDPNVLQSILPSSKRKPFMDNVRVCIIDEAPSLHIAAFEAAARVVGPVDGGTAYHSVPNRDIHPNDGDEIGHFSTSFDKLHSFNYSNDDDFYDGIHPGICRTYTLTTHLQQQETYPTFWFPYDIRAQNSTTGSGRPSCVDVVLGFWRKVLVRRDKF